MNIFKLLMPLLMIVPFVGADTLPLSEGSRSVKPIQLPRIVPLKPVEWSEQQRRLLSPLEADGQVFNIFATMAKNPELMKVWNPLGLYLLRESSFPARDRELLILRVAWLAQSEYEFGQHTLIGLTVGLSKSDIKRVTENLDEATWGDRDFTLLRAVDELHHNSTISDSTWLKLREVYDERQMLDLLATVGQYRSLAMLLNSLNVALDEGISGFPENNESD